MSEKEKNNKNKETNIEEIKEVFEQLKKDNKELVETLQRLQADFENYKKREEKNKEDFVKFCTAGILIEFLEFIDSFEIAIQKCTEEQKKAIQPLYNQLKSFLEKKGIKAFESINEKFNPEKHEILQTSFDENKEDNIILEEFKKGYLMHGKILRHAQVKVNKKQTKNETTEQNTKTENNSKKEEQGVIQNE